MVSVDSDREVKLMWGDGETSRYTNIARLTKPTDAERASFDTDNEFHRLAYHCVAYEARCLYFGRCDAAGTVTL